MAVWKNQLAPIFTLWENVSKAYIEKSRGVEVRQASPDDAPVVGFVLMDTGYAMRLVEKVNKSLQTLQKVISGAVLSTPEIQAEARSLMRSEVPTSWTTNWPSAPEDPTVFLPGLAKRLGALRGDWMRRIQGNNPVDNPVQLSDFLRAEVFLNALRQQTARKLKVSIDSLHLVASFEPQLLSDSATSPLPVSVQSLILEGCVFDESQRILVEGNRTSPLVSVLPTLTIAWMSKTAHPEKAVSTAKKAATVGMPIYVDLTRERLVAEVFLHTNDTRQRTFNSAALFLTDSS